MKENLKKKQKKIKEEKGAISALALFTVLMFSIILLGTYFTINTMQRAQLKSDKRIQDLYYEDVKRVNYLYDELVENQTT